MCECTHIHIYVYRCIHIITHIWTCACIRPVQFSTYTIDVCTIYIYTQYCMYTCIDPGPEAIHSCSLAWKSRSASWKTTILYVESSMSFHVPYPPSPRITPTYPGPAPLQVASRQKLKPSSNQAKTEILDPKTYNATDYKFNLEFRPRPKRRSVPRVFIWQPAIGSC